MTLDLSPKGVALRFSGVVATLTFLHSVALYVYFSRGGYGELGAYFDLGIEANVPTLYSAIALLVSATLLWVHGVESRTADDGEHRYWFGLAAVMAFLGVDEGIVIHEHLSGFFERFMVAEGLLYYLWVVPYGVAFLLFGLAYLGFLRRLPRRTTGLFVLAGGVFVGGAVGVEMLSAQAGELLGTESLRFSILYTIEEFLEMTGIVVFIYALLAHGADQAGVWTIRIARGGGEA